MGSASVSLERSTASPQGVRSTLEQRGGLFAEFGRFLSLRTDLLPWDYAVALEGIRTSAPPISREDFLAALHSVFGTTADDLATTVEKDPCWSTTSRCAYLARHRGLRIVIQATRPRFNQADWSEFHAGILAYRDRKMFRATSQTALDQFEEWYKLAENPTREKSYLQSLAAFGGIHALYPELVPDLCKDQFLAWTWLDGVPLPEHLAGGGDIVHLADFVLEQITFLAIVDADLDARNLAFADGRIIVRRTNRLVSLPTSSTSASLRYVASVLQRDPRSAARVLASLASTEIALESRLADKLSNLEPELKLDLKLSAPAIIFENNWRALSAVYPEKKLFLDAIHRNLMLVAFWNTRAKIPIYNGSDPVEEAYWPVLARILRHKLLEYAKPENLRSTLLLSGTVVVESLRQFKRMTDAVRDDDLRVSLAEPPDEPEDSAASNRQVFRAITMALLLLVFLIAIRWSTALPAYSVAFTILAILSGLVLLWILLRGD